MKTKKFAIASCALLFTACSDGIDEFCQQQENLHEERPQALITIDANNRTDKQTRFEFKNTDVGYRWVFQDGDKMGALRMDKLKSAGQYGNWDDYEFDDLCHANRAFTYDWDEDLFYTENEGKATIDEGHYFFYYPYDENVKGDGERIAFSVNPIQEIYPIQDPRNCGAYFYELIENYQKYIGYKFIKGQNDAESRTNAQKIEMSMVPLFATPLIYIENNSCSKFMIDKIVIKRSDGEILPTTVFLSPKTMEFGEYLASYIDPGNGVDYDFLTQKMRRNTLYTPNCPYIVNSNAEIERDYMSGTYNILANPYISPSYPNSNYTYQYEIQFPENWLIEDSFHNTQKNSIYAYIVVPPFGFDDIKICIYGSYFDLMADNGRGGWVQTVINYDSYIFDRRNITLSFDELKLHGY